MNLQNDVIITNKIDNFMSTDPISKLIDILVFNLDILNRWCMKLRNEWIMMQHYTKWSNQTKIYFLEFLVENFNETTCEISLVRRKIHQYLPRKKTHQNVSHLPHHIGAIRFIACSDCIGIKTHGSWACGTTLKCCPPKWSAATISYQMLTCFMMPKIKEAIQFMHMLCLLWMRI